MSSNVPPTAIPLTQNTALVLEFQCLYTSDLRKKQKKWQDGKLRFHAFNKRIMLYDERMNLVTDGHWREDYDLQEGEEVNLERGILAQVAECVGRKEQDLSELLDKRLKEKEDRNAARIAGSSPLRTPGTAARPQRSTTTTNASSQLRPRSLDALLGTPSGHHGRAALPMMSPFEERQRMNISAGNESIGRPRKKLKRVESPPSKNGYAQALTGATLTLSGRPPLSISTLRYTSMNLSVTNEHEKVETIDLSGDDPANSGHNTAGTNIPRKYQQNIRDLAAPQLPAKRRRVISPPRKSGYAQQLTGPQLVLSGTATARRPTLHEKSNNVKEAAVQGTTTSGRIPNGFVKETHINTEPSSSDGFCNIDAFDLSQRSKHGVAIMKGNKKESVLVETFPDEWRPTPAANAYADASAPPHDPKIPKDPKNHALSPPAKSLSPSISTTSVPIPQLISPVPCGILSSPQIPSHSVKSPDIETACSKTSEVMYRPSMHLRIAARPPRKKLMCISQPASSTRSASVPFDGESSDVLTEKNTEVQPSQATANLIKFRKNQEQKLLERVTHANTTDDEVDDFFQTQVATTIDHQTIDALLSRNPVPRAEKQTKRILSRMQSLHEPQVLSRQAVSSKQIRSATGLKRAQSMVVSSTTMQNPYASSRNPSQASESPVPTATEKSFTKILEQDQCPVPLEHAQLVGNGLQMVASVANSQPDSMAGTVSGLQSTMTHVDSRLPCASHVVRADTFKHHNFTEDVSAAIDAADTICSPPLRVGQLGTHPTPTHDSPEDLLHDGSCTTHGVLEAVAGEIFVPRSQSATVAKLVNGSPPPVTLARIHDRPSLLDNEQVPSDKIPSIVPDAACTTITGSQKPLQDTKAEGTCVGFRPYDPCIDPLAVTLMTQHGLTETSVYENCTVDDIEHLKYGQSTTTLISHGQGDGLNSTKSMAPSIHGATKIKASPSSTDSLFLEFLPPEVGTATQDATQVKASPSYTVDVTREFTEQPPRLINPATRGRKAAGEAHKAGKVPETVVPPAPLHPQMPRSILAGGNARQEKPALPRGELLKVARDTGPWSREAFDLFDWRPPNEGT